MSVLETPYVLNKSVSDSTRLYRWFSDDSGTKFSIETGFTAGLCDDLRRTYPGRALHLSHDVIRQHIPQHLAWKRESSPSFSFSILERQTTQLATNFAKRAMAGRRDIKMKVAVTTVGDLRRQGCQVIAATDFEGKGYELLVAGWAPVELFEIHALFYDRGMLSGSCDNQHS